MLTVDILYLDDGSFKEEQHPRAKSGSHAGQFVKKGSGGGAPSLPKGTYKGVTKVHEIGTSTSLAHGEKIDLIQEIAAKYAKGATTAHAAKWLKHLQKESGIAPSKPSEAQAKLADFIEKKKAAQNPLPPGLQGQGGPGPHPSSKQQQEAFEVVNNPDLSKTEKIQVLNWALENIAAEQGSGGPRGYTAEYLKTWIKELGGEVELPLDKKDDEPKPKEPESKPLAGPAPNASSTLQKEMFEIVQSDISTEKKIDYLKTKMSHLDPPAYSYKFANEWIKALGGEPVTQPAAPEANVIKPTKPPASWKAAKERFLNAVRSGDGWSSSKAAEVMPLATMGKWQDVPAQMRKSCTDYTGIHSGSINSALRADNADYVAPNTLDHIHNIDALFEEDVAKAAKDFVVLRGMDPMPAAAMTKMKKSLAQGLPTRFHQEGFISTSFATTPAFESKPLHLEIVVRKGAPALPIKLISNHPGENEVLLRHGQAFEVLEILENQPNGKTLIRMVTV